MAVIPNKPVGESPQQRVIDTPSFFYRYLRLIVQETLSYERFCEIVKNDRDAAGVDPARLWVLFDEIKRTAIGAPLPYPTAEAVKSGEAFVVQPEIANPSSDRLFREWYAYPCSTLCSLERGFALESSSAYVEDVLEKPEGARYLKRLLIEEVASIALRLWPDLEEQRLQAACLGALAPSDAREKLVANAFSAMLEPDDASFDANFLESLYRKVVSGIEVVESPEETAAMVSSRQSLLGLLCASVAGSPGNGSDHHRLVSSIIVHDFICIYRPFPVGNDFLAVVARFLYLQKNGMPFMAFSPMTQIVRSWKDGAISTSADLAIPPFDKVLQPVGGHLEWTLYFDTVVNLTNRRANKMLDDLCRLKYARKRYRELLKGTGRFNPRQRELIIEALMNPDREFTFQDVQQRYGVSYPSAHDDLMGLEIDGFIEHQSIGKRHAFHATTNILATFLRNARKDTPEVYEAFYNNDGTLKESYIQKCHEETRAAIARGRLSSAMSTTCRRASSVPQALRMFADETAISSLGIHPEP